ncbi:MAG: lipopolysaccharide transport system permease protein [Psychromonas sp.]|jgi:lipopolysaccharide transport system permease protein
MKKEETTPKIGFTEVIKPKDSIWDVKLKEIWKYRDLILLFVRRDFVSIYKQTILGPLWLFIQPLFTTVIFYFIFTKVAKIPTNGIDPILFYLSGITLWTYFADCLNKTSNTFVSNAGIFGKVYFPRLTAPISIVISNLIKFAIQMALFVVVLIGQHFINGTSITPNLTLLLFPFYVIVMAVLGLGLGIIFSSLTTKYRDLGFLLGFGVQLMMYATPVIYPLQYTEGKLNTIISYNPLTSILENMRYALFSQGHFDLNGLIYTTTISISVLSIGIIVFNRVEKSFMDTV